MSRVLFGAYLCPRCQWHRVHEPEDMHVHVLRDGLDVALLEDLPVRAIRENLHECGVRVEAREDLRQGMLPRADAAIDARELHRGLVKPVSRITLSTPSAGWIPAEGIVLGAAFQRCPESGCSAGKATGTGPLQSPP